MKITWSVATPHEGHSTKYILSRAIQQVEGTMSPQVPRIGSVAGEAPVACSTQEKVHNTGVILKK